jgi:hypothetical protein
MNNFIVINATYRHKLYNFFDIIKNKIAYKEDIPIYNLYNGPNCDFIPQKNDYFLKNKTSSNIENFNPSSYEVKDVYEMFQKFYFFINEKINELTQYDYIIRCNSSSFLNFKIIKQIIDQLPKSNCYAGVALNSVLVSGTCIFFSKDVLLKLAETPIENIPYTNNYDDVAIGNLIAGTYKISPIHIPQYNLSTGIIPNNDEILNALRYPTIRVRNNNNREHIDVHIWNELFKYYQNL